MVERADTLASGGLVHAAAGRQVEASLITQSLLALALSAAAAVAGLTLNYGQANATPLWLGNVFVMAFLVRRPPVEWPLLVVAGFAGNCLGVTLLRGHPLLACSLAFANSLDSLIAAACLRRLGNGPNLNLTKPLVLTRFVMLCGGLAPLVSATVALIPRELVTGGPWLAYWTMWFLARGLGTLIFAPVLVQPEVERWRELLSPARRVETATVLLAVAATTAAEFSQQRYPLLFCSFPVLLLAAFRLGLAGTKVAIVATAVIAIGLTAAGHGPTMLAHGADLPQRIILLQAFLAVALLTALQVAAVLEARRALERDLLESEARFRQLIDGVADHALYMLDEAGRISSWNAGAERLKGYSRDQALGQPHGMFFTPEEVADEVPDQILAVARAFGKYEGDGARLRSDGTRFWVNTAVNRVFDEEGNAVGYAVVTQDVTERRQIQEQLTRENARSRAILEVASDGICVLDPAGNLIEASSAFFDLIGWPPHARKGLSIRDWDPAAAATPLAASGLHALPRLTERSFRRYDGRPIDVEISAKVVEFDRLPYIYASVRDITERKRTAEELRTSEAAFRGAFETAAHGMALVSPTGKWLQVNQALCDMLGYQASELLAVDFQTITHPDDLRADLALFRAVLAGELPSYMMEKRYFHKQGSIVWILLSVSIVRADDGRPLFAVSQIQDITQQKHAEDALRQSEIRFRAVTETAGEAIITIDVHEDIIYANPAATTIFGYPVETPATGETLTGVRISTLVPGYRNGDGLRESDGVRADGERIALEYNSADWLSDGDFRRTLILRDVTLRQLERARLDESIQEKETLLREVYHRVKNNLQVIQSLLRISGRTLPAGDGRTAIEEAAARVRAMALVHEKLYQSRNLARIDLANYVGELLRLVASASGISARHVRMTTAIPPMEVGLDTAVPLGLLINELVSNCMKHAFPDGREGEIRIEIEAQQGGGATVKVSDDGIGLPDGFELTELHSMGLAIATSLARQLGGDLRIESREHSCFAVDVAAL